MTATKSSIRNLSRKDEEQTIRTLARYYPLNEETNTFEIALHYEKASDIFEENADILDKATRISEGITDRMSEMLDDIPKGYSADVSIRIDDFEGYTSEQMMDGLKDTFNHTMQRMWVNFAKTGDPSLTAEESPTGQAIAWEPYNSDTKTIMVFDEFNIHQGYEADYGIVDWERTYPLTKYFIF